ncbi:hypothetical protein ANO11243_067620 [Dothideomycetidae sp. 11243]|nr:hypothetical protein ANO11243_067620 [fungal sp. No.11243]
MPNASHVPLRSLLNKKSNVVENPPNGGAVAWLQVVACFFIFMNNFGLASAFGVYQAYYEEVLAFSPFDVAWIGTVQASLTLLVGVAAGPLFDKGYFFKIVMTASAGLVLSFMLLSICHRYWQILLCQGFLCGVCTGMLYIPSIAQIPQYFSPSRKRNFAIGLVLSGAPVGGVIYPLIFRNLLPSAGFPWATRAVGFLALGFLSISIVLVKPLNVRNKPAKLKDPKMFKDFVYVAFVIASFFFFCGMMIPYFDCATFWWARFDHNIDSAFHTLLIINAGNFAGRLLFPVSVDLLLGGDILILLCTIALSILGFSWISIQTRAAYYVFLVLWGFFSGGIATLPAVILPLLAPRPEVYATRLGVVYAAAGVGVLIGAPIANATNNGRRSFLGPQLWIGITSLLGLVAAILAFGYYHLRRKPSAEASAEEAGTESTCDSVPGVDIVDDMQLQSLGK